MKIYDGRMMKGLVEKDGSQIRKTSKVEIKA
jgi:hypothetical protein